jgi:hypothetical protein
MLCGSSTRQDVPVNVLAGEPYLDPRSRYRKISHRFRHEVLEGPIQMWQPDLYEDTGHRIDPGGLRRR